MEYEICAMCWIRLGLLFLSGWLLQQSLVFDDSHYSDVLTAHWNFLGVHPPFPHHSSVWQLYTVAKFPNFLDSLVMALQTVVNTSLQIWCFTANANIHENASVKGANGSIGPTLLRGNSPARNDHCYEYVRANRFTALRCMVFTCVWKTCCQPVSKCRGREIKSCHQQNRNYLY